MARVLVAQLGARRHYAVPRALHRSGLLDVLITDECADISPWRWFARLVPGGLRGYRWLSLLGRTVPDVPVSRIESVPQIGYRLFKGPCRGERRTDYWARRNAAFGRAVVRRGFGDATTVYAFNGAALEVFHEAKRLGLRTILDQTAAPWRWNARLLRDEIGRWPSWEDRPSELDLSGILSEREEAERALADAIVCGSEFCRSTLLDTGAPESKCHVLRYPPVNGVAPEYERRSSEKRARVLFAGTLQLRKGVQYLYQAARRLASDSIEIRLVGPSLLSDEAREKLASYCDVRGAVPRPQMADHYRWADVLVLPTLSEGSANVCHEAMAAGLPVITTRAAGSLVRDGVDGLIVPERDAGALVAAIAYMAANPRMRHLFGDSARARIDDYRETDLYAKRLRAIVSDVNTQSYEGKASVSCV